MHKELAETLVLDTSVWINILATKETQRILNAISRSYLVPPQVLAEVKRDPITKQAYSNVQHPLRAGPPIHIVPLSNDELSLFIELVSAPIIDRLGDGEAAAIAVALCRNSTLVIDERKARRGLRDKFSKPSLLGSVDLLRRTEVALSLGQDLYEKCFENARRFGRMHMHVIKPRNK
jgi:predicted nucleic acid-binding protein